MEHVNFARYCYSNILCSKRHIELQRQKYRYLWILWERSKRIEILNYIRIIGDFAFWVVPVEELILVIFPTHLYHVLIINVMAVNDNLAGSGWRVSIYLKALCSAYYVRKKQTFGICSDECQIYLYSSSFRYRRDHNHSIGRQFIIIVTILNKTDAVVLCSSEKLEFMQWFTLNSRVFVPRFLFETCFVVDMVIIGRFLSEKFYSSSENIWLVEILESFHFNNLRKLWLFDIPSEVFIDC